MRKYIDIVAGQMSKLQGTVSPLTLFLESKSQIKSNIIYVFIPITPELGLGGFPLLKFSMNFKCLAEIILLLTSFHCHLCVGVLWGPV